MPCMAQSKALIAPAEAAAMLSVHRATLNRWAAEGKLHPVILPSGHSRYRIEEIEAILAGSAA
jgi:excisionase family DNA binding protein